MHFKHLKHNTKRFNLLISLMFRHLFKNLFLCRFYRFINSHYVKRFNLRSSKLEMNNVHIQSLNFKRRSSKILLLNTTSGI